MYVQDLAIQILKDARKPLHAKEIADRIMEAGLWSSDGKTPEVAMNAQLVAELKRAKASGEPGRFVRTPPGYYSLVKWMGTGLPYQISKHNRGIRKKLLSQLMDLSPAQFEEIVGQLLAEMAVSMSGGPCLSAMWCA